MPRLDPARLSVKELKQQLRAQAVDFSDCLEVEDLRSRLHTHVETKRREQASQRARRVAEEAVAPGKRTGRASKRTSGGGGGGGGGSAKPPPSAGLLSPADRAGVQLKWGAAFEKVEKSAVAVFRELETDGDAHLDRSEFSGALGVMGIGSSPLANFMFDAIDTDKSGQISFLEFVTWMLTMMHGEPEDKLRFGFAIMDIDNDGEVSRAEVTTLLQSMTCVLTGLRVTSSTSSEVEAFVSSFFDRYDINGDGSISWEEYKRGCASYGGVIRSLNMEQGAEAWSKKTERWGGTEADGEPSGPAGGRKMGQHVFFGERKFSFMLSVMVGMQLAVESDRATPPLGGGEDGEGGEGGKGGGSSRKVELHEKRKHKLNGPDQSHHDDGTDLPKSKFELPTEPGAPKLVLTAYGTAVFKKIRQAFGVTEDDFLGSLGIRQVIGSLLMGDIAGLSEMVSEGRSGCLFYWSHDSRFLVKTINKEESEALRRMAQRYRAHVDEYPSTLLTRTLGTYKLRTGGARGEVHYLVVMQNVFRTPLVIHERFDLKGSTYNRTVGAEARGTKGLVHKDLDWVQMGRRVVLPPRQAVALTEQIAADARFLGDEGIIDYSLLVGVHYTGVHRKRKWRGQRQGELRELFDKFRALCGTGSGDGGAAAAVAPLPPGGVASASPQGDSAPLFGKLDFDAFCDMAYDASEHPAVRDILGAEQGPAPAASSSSETGAGGKAERSSISGGVRGKPNLFSSHLGGLQPVARGEDEGENQVVFMGIIDTLIPFKMKKKTEYIAKTAALGKNANFSVIPPPDYMERFITFMSSQVVGSAAEMHVQS